jgi:hypothetical protein
MAGLSPGDIASAIAVFTFISGSVGGIVTYVIRKRSASGLIITSDAATLWAQSQAMREDLLKDKIKAEEQRDHLLDTMEGHIVPTLHELNRGMVEIAKVCHAILEASRAQPGGVVLSGLSDRTVSDSQVLRAILDGVRRSSGADVPYSDIVFNLLQSLGEPGAAPEGGSGDVPSPDSKGG